MSRYPQETIKPYNESENKTKQVEEMFDNIAPTYDHLNHLLSFDIDKFWRRKAIRMLKPFQPQQIMDVATGTGDFAIQAYQILRPKRLLGIDISEGMMNIGREKVKQAHLSEYISFMKEDCMSLSFPDNQFDAITVAFGIRNFEDLDKGLREMYRVLVPEGHLVILELSYPEKFIIKQLYDIYAGLIIPTIGKMLSKDHMAYTYLPQTIKAFPQGEVMKNILHKAGFRKAILKRLTFGTCTLYFATK